MIALYRKLRNQRAKHWHSGTPLGLQQGDGTGCVDAVLAIHIAGYPPTLLFAGSWSDWSTRMDLPVAFG